MDTGLSNSIPQPKMLKQMSFARQEIYHDLNYRSVEMLAADTDQLK